MTPNISEHDVCEQVKRSKKTKPGVPGDLPKKILQMLPQEMSKPVTELFKKMLATKQWPAMWTTEYGLPLQKQKNPANENYLRIISLTPLFSKTFESFVIKWLIEFIGDKIDPNNLEAKRVVL